MIPAKGVVGVMEIHSLMEAGVVEHVITTILRKASSS